MRTSHAVAAGFIAALTTICFTLLPAAAIASEPPKLMVDGAEHDFGTVGQGQIVKHDFTLRNAGGAELVVERMVTSCGCTASSISADRIPPGGTGVVDVEFDTSGFSGEKSKGVRVYTNDPGNSAAVLTLRGTVVPDIVLEPARLMFGELRQSELEAAPTREFTVKVREGSGAKITEIRSYSKHLNVEELSSGDSERRVRVTLLPEVPAGDLRERVVISLSGSKTQAMNVPVSAVIKGGVTFSPPMLSFGVIDPDAQQLKRTVRFENFTPDPIALTGVSSNHPGVQATFKPVKQGKVYDIEVLVDPAQVKGDLKALLTVKTDAPDHSALSLNVYGVPPPAL